MKPIPARPANALVRTAATVVATAAMALLAVACGSSPPSTGADAPPNAGGTAATGGVAAPGGTASTGGSASSQLVAYSQCMRSHGVPNFPDPTGAVPPKGGARQFGVSSSQLQAAETACQHLLPTSESFQQQVQQCETTGDCPQAVVHQALTIMRQYAQCMRSHGVPNFPDPTVGSGGRPVFDVSGAGLSYQFTHSPQFASKDAVCERLVGGSAGVPVPLE
jgi:hypothetical protein